MAGQTFSIQCPHRWTAGGLFGSAKFHAALCKLRSARKDRDAGDRAFGCWEGETGHEGALPAPP